LVPLLHDRERKQCVSSVHTWYVAMRSRFPDNGPFDDAARPRDMARRAFLVQASALAIRALARKRQLPWHSPSQVPPSMLNGTVRSALVD
jgi:hypothetical protein